MEHRDIHLTYKWMPSIRITLVDADKREYRFPQVGTWLAEHHDLGGNFLSARQCKALWKWLGRTDPPPKKLAIMLNREDIMRIWPPKS